MFAFCLLVFLPSDIQGTFLGKYLGSQYKKINLLPGQCSLNLDGLTGKYPPLLIQNDDFIYPTSQEADGSRLLVFGSTLLQLVFTPYRHQYDRWCYYSLYLKMKERAWSCTATGACGTRPPPRWWTARRGSTLAPPASGSPAEGRGSSRPRTRWGLLTSWPGTRAWPSTTSHSFNENLFEI